MNDLDIESYLGDLREGVPLLAESVLGRMLVASLFANFLTGVALAVLPAGMLLGGLAGARLGSRTVMLASALGSVLAAGYWLGVPELRRFGPPTAVSSGQFGAVETN